jgi:hypothetical protein
MLRVKRRTALALFWATLVFSIFIQSYDFGSLDTTRRYQATLAIWNNVPAASLEDIEANYALTGVNGSKHFWYGMGQSIFLLPGSLTAAGIFGLMHLRDSAVEASFEQALVSLLTFPLLSACTVVIAFLLLLELEFSMLPALYGVLAFFFGTTFLHYTQVHQENSQLVFLVIAACYMHLLWLKQKRILPLVIGSGLLGVSLLFRITSAADIVSETLFILLILSWHSSKFKDLKATIQGNRSNIITFCLAQFLASAGFFAIDRLYQFKRFGEWTSTYIDVLARQIRQGTVIYYYENIDTKWPFNLPRLTGLSNVLFSPEKSIFIYDPLLVVLIGVVLIRRFNLGQAKQIYSRSAYLISWTVCLGLYLYGYSNVIFWGGDSSWGARYHTMPIQMLCLLAIPLFVEKIVAMKKVWQWLITLGLVVALCTQLMSIIFPYALEIIQQNCNGSSFRLGQRTLNLVAFLTGGVNVNPQCTGLTSSQLEVPYFWPFIDYTTQAIPPIVNTIADLIWLLLGIWAVQKFTILILKTKKVEVQLALTLQQSKSTQYAEEIF